MQVTKKTILIAEDDEGIADVTRIIVEQMGISAVTVSSKKALMTTLREQHIDMILLDIWITDGNGAEITKELKKDPFLKDIPIFLLSANTFIEKLARDSGADGFIEKPFSIEYLEKIVQNTIK